MKQWKRPLGWFSRFMLFLNFLALIAILLSYLAPYVDPNTFWPIAFAGLVYPVLLIINVFFMVYWLYRKRMLAVMGLLPILLGWGILTKNIGWASKQEDIHKDSTALRLMSYNVHLFKNYKDEMKGSIKTEVLKIFKDVQPDVLCLQEFYTQKKGTNDIRSFLTNTLDYNHHFFQKVVENDFDAYGIAIFSKYPIVASGSLPINIKRKTVNRIVYADINKDGQLLRVYNVHLQSIGFQKEDYAFITTGLSNMDEDLSSTKRIGGRLKNAFIKRSKQVEVLHEHIKTCEIPYVVVGDFNDTPTSYSVNKISRGMNNAFKEKGRGWGITYNGDFPNVQIDYILASKEFKIKRFQIIPERLSDHYPIWSDLEL